MTSIGMIMEMKVENRAFTYTYLAKQIQKTKDKNAIVTKASYAHMQYTFRHLTAKTLGK